MRGQLIEEISSLNKRAGDLLKEKQQLKENYNDDDIKQLKEKLGGRCCMIAYKDVEKDIQKDFDVIMKKLADEIVGGYTQEVESKLRSTIHRLIFDIINKFFCGIANLPDEPKILIRSMVDDEVRRLISELK